MNNWKKTAAFLTVISLLFVSGCTFEPKKEEVNLGMHVDLSFAGSLHSMIDRAPLIVFGEYQGINRLENGARNPINPSLPAKNTYHEVEVYDFDVIKILKGELEQDNIQVGMAHKLQLQINDRKKIEINHPLYIKPQEEKKYILFLNYPDPYTNYYTFPFTPHSIQFDHRNVARLLIPPLGDQQQEIQSHDQTYKITIDGFPDKYHDQITGKPLSTLFNLIEVVLKLNHENL
ncbi:hypothetical protein [Thermoactinomyces mirandus]|uniref:Lipoprotein n=1 Tax=Thermoactinomyces mirandus TaxID=2756294 RepID=A0A7W1XRE9_9BACL|nr:hypothetical protein [Thermoactinomyces mirandus]MBA4601660.1 hypothetical protein [Thermoactinomyces mirandus]